MSLFNSVWADVTKYHRLGLYKQQKSIAHITGAEKPRSVHSMVWLGEGLFLNLAAVFSLCPHLVEGAELSLWSLLYKNTDSALMT